MILLGFSVAAQNTGAQAPPLNFGTNYFVTGDYVVAGAQGLNASFRSDGFGTGTICFLDGNPGIRGATTVPNGANILATILYWQTVEKATQPCRRKPARSCMSWGIPLLHGGGDGTNCKSNYQSVMNYVFQAHLLGPNVVLGFSNQQLSTLDETSLGPIKTLDLLPIAMPFTRRAS